MIRPTLLFGALSLLALDGVAAQSTPAAGPPLVLMVEIPAPAMLSGFPQSWRDSVVGAWTRRATPARLAAMGPVPPGTFGEVTLQLMRNGDLRRARIRTSTGTVALDSLLLVISHDTDEALAFPPFPPRRGGGRHRSDLAGARAAAAGARDAGPERRRPESPGEGAGALGRPSV